MRSRRLLGLAAVVVGVLLLAACGDDGPQGPGGWNVRVRSSGVPPGGATVELRGVAIESVEGVGGTSAFGAPLSSQGGTPVPWRMIVVAPVPGELNFLIRVNELADGPPRPAVVAAVDGDDQPVTVATFSVDFHVAR